MRDHPLDYARYRRKRHLHRGVMSLLNFDEQTGDVDWFGQEDAISDLFLQLQIGVGLITQNCNQTVRAYSRLQ